MNDDTYDNHTCHDNCPRIACVLRRELTAVTEQRDRMVKALEQLMTYQPRSTVIAMNEHHVWRNAKVALQSLTNNQND
jgi:formate hydrogenlyase subunit 6/NADH:ubiquinone oxidoreductase subunit I